MKQLLKCIFYNYRTMATAVTWHCDAWRYTPMVLLLLLFVTCRFLWLLPWPITWITWPQSLKSLHTSHVCPFLLDTCIFFDSPGSWSVEHMSFVWSWLSWALSISNHSPAALSHAIGSVVKMLSSAHCLSFLKVIICWILVFWDTIIRIFISNHASFCQLGFLS